jgi:hypothetical protein
MDCGKQDIFSADFQKSHWYLEKPVCLFQHRKCNENFELRKKIKGEKLFCRKTSTKRA